MWNVVDLFFKHLSRRFILPALFICLAFSLVIVWPFKFFRVYLFFAIAACQLGHFLSMDELASKMVFVGLYFLYFARLVQLCVVHFPVHNSKIIALHIEDSLFPPRITVSYG